MYYDQCWNMLLSTHLAFGMEGIAKAANNQNTGTLTKLNSNGTTEYTYSSGTIRKQSGSGFGIPDGSTTVVEAEDTFDRWSAVGIHISGEVEKKLGEMNSNWPDTITASPIKTPLIISSVMTSLSFAGIFLGLFIAWLVNYPIIYILIAILLSIFSITSILFCIIRASNHDKSKLKDMTFDQISFQYRGMKLKLQNNTDPTSPTITPGQTGERTEDASGLSTATNHFYIETNTKPRVEVSSAGNAVLKELDLAKLIL